MSPLGCLKNSSICPKQILWARTCPEHAHAFFPFTVSILPLLPPFTFTIWDHLVLSALLPYPVSGHHHCFSEHFSGFPASFLKFSQHPLTCHPRRSWRFIVKSQVNAVQLLCKTFLWFLFLLRPKTGILTGPCLKRFKLSPVSFRTLSP